ncbi:UDP-glucose/GDP-mannose dehydrogenase family protein, partial [Pseudomonas sp. EA_15y_Pfl2_R67]|uniref:UDP-glucose/GDP-mannose dehydrogenase family protein n=1 Tax=Pseudomonas sp. EA_15y_Pfl2_R67 TaxID=3088687 RepID=UPI0030D7C8E0
VCLRLPAYSASAKVICFIIEKLGDWCPVILPNQEVFFRVSLGIAYKKNIDDFRESPAIEILSQLMEKQAQVHYSDPYIPRIVGAD